MPIFKQREMRVPVMDMRLLIEEAQELETAFEFVMETIQDDHVHSVQVFKNFVANFNKALRDIMENTQDE